MDATRISDGRPVMLKKVPLREGPYELQINKIFSTEPVYSDPRNHCVHLLDVIELPNDPPILVQPLLRPFYKPPLLTFGVFVTFFAQICEVSLVVLNVTNRMPESRREYNSCTKITSLIGWVTSMLTFPSSLTCPMLGTVQSKTSCLTHRTCIPNLFTLSG